MTEGCMHIPHTISSKIRTSTYKFQENTNMPTIAREIIYQKVALNLLVGTPLPIPVYLGNLRFVF